MAFSKLQSRILSAAEAVQAAKLHGDMLPEQQAWCRRTWHWHVLDSHAQVTDRTGTECAVEDGYSATLDAGPRSTCALRKGMGI